MTANRVVECISSVYRYGATCGLVDRTHNPIAQIEAFREQRRERFLTNEELGRLGEAIREAETTGIPWEVDETRPTAKHAAKPENRRIVIGLHAAAALRLLILTGGRASQMYAFMICVIPTPVSALARDLGSRSLARCSVILNPRAPLDTHTLTQILFAPPFYSRVPAESSRRPLMALGRHRYRAE